MQVTENRQFRRITVYNIVILLFILMITIWMKEVKADDDHSYVPNLVGDWSGTATVASATSRTHDPFIFIDVMLNISKQDKNLFIGTATFQIGHILQEFPIAGVINGRRIKAAADSTIFSGSLIYRKGKLRMKGDWLDVLESDDFHPSAAVFEITKEKRDWFYWGETD